MKFKNWLFGLQKQNVARKPAAARTVTESLEVRIVPAAVALFIGVSGELSVTMDADDSVRIGSANGNVTVDASSGGGAFVRLTTIGTLPAANVRQITVLGSDEPNGIDLSGVSAAAYTTLATISADGANGNDTLLGSPDIADNFNGGDGTDLLQSGGGNDTLNGGNGNDTINAGAGNDSVRGGDGQDVITGDAGDDSINSGNGDDTVSGGDGNDTVFGDNGQDVITGDAGNDFLNGDGGLDTVDGGDNDDSILGGEFADSLLGGNGNDTINGQAGSDSISGDGGNDSLLGGVGNDRVDGGSGNDLLNGNADNDTMTGGDNEDLVTGGSGMDSLNGGFGNDRVLGQGGNDTVAGGGGSDTLDGGDGNDLVQSADVTAAVVSPVITIGDVSVAEGSGLFAPGVAYPAGNGSQTVTAADLDGDGDLDLAVGNNIVTNTLTLLRNNGAGQFTTAGTVSTGQGDPRFVTHADVNADGREDLIVANGRNALVFVNNGNFAFTLTATIASNLDPWEVTVADFNADGNLDVATGDNFGNGPNVSVAYGNGNGTFQTSFTVETGAFSGGYGVTAADLNGDGATDLAYVNGVSNVISVLINNRSGGNQPFAPAVLYPSGGNIESSVRAADFNGDGRLDFVTANRGSGDISVLFNNGNGVFGAPTIYSAGPNVTPFELTVGDFDSDGDVDVATANFSANFAASVFLNNGNGTFVAPTGLPFPGRSVLAQGIATGDLNGDGQLDLVTANVVGDTVAVFLNQGQTPFNFPVTLSAPSAVPVTVNFSTVNGTAQSGLDYLATSGTATFAPGQTSLIVSINALPDSQPEANESFFVNLSGATNATLSDSQAQGLILNDDGGITPNLLTLSVNDIALTEGNANTMTASFTVTLSAPSAVTVSVGFATGDASAQSPSDYVATTGSVIFASGVTTQTVNVTVQADANFEPNETFFLNLLNPSGATLGDSLGVATITNDDPVPPPSSPNDTLFGGNGNDTLVGSIGNDVFNGQAGNDSIIGGDGNDSLLGGGGKDTLDGQIGDDTLDGQAGDDTLIGGDGQDTFVFGGIGSGIDSADGGEGLNTISARGTNLADTLNVGQASGVLVVNTGTDSLAAMANIQVVVVDGQAGNDTITVGSLNGLLRARVEIRGGEGNDLLDAFNANPGAVRLSFFGDDGNDTINGSLGSDTINGNAGDDSLCGYAGDDTMIGELGNDSLGGSLGNDSVSGGDGNDLLNGQLGDDSVAGGIGDDVLKGEDGHDTLAGELGDDQLNGGAGNDSLTGLSGRDALVGGAGNDTLQGGRNDDTLNGNSGNDLVAGDHGHDYIDAGTGADSIGGGDGDDTIVTFDGNDFVSGGDGNDRINTSSGDDVINGGDGNDSILGGGGSDIILGGNGDDVIDGQGGTDTVAGQQGVDFLSDPLAEINDNFVLNAALAAILRTL